MEGRKRVSARARASVRCGAATVARSLARSLALTSEREVVTPRQASRTEKKSRSATSKRPLCSSTASAVKGSRRSR